MTLRSRAQRRLVPRWKLSTAATSARDFSSLKPAPSVRVSPVNQPGAAFESFRVERDIGTAAEALAEAIVEGNQQSSRVAATFLLQHQNEIPSALLNLARTANGEMGQRLALETSDVAKTRALLRLSPNNPALWSDLARHHSTHGEKKRASRCMKVAMQLAPNHRWMLRTAARFFVHQEDAEAAHRLLARHPRTKLDPWLIAAELACAQVAGRAPKFWKLANDIVRFDRFSSGNISELATAVAMMEIESGNRRHAKKLILRGLLAPTENTLAQVLWAQDRRHLGDDFPMMESLAGKLSDAHEAGFKISLGNGDLANALKASRAWQVDEPFAIRPKHETMYVASLLDDHSLSLRTANAARKLDGKLAEGMELNEIFAKLSAGGLQDAEKIQIEARLRTLMARGDVFAVQATANLALWNYRFGKRELGAMLYKRAIELARRADGYESAAHAAMFATREAILAGEPFAATLLDEARELAQRSKSAPATFYLGKLDALLEAPDKAKEILSPSYFARTAPPLKLIRVTKDDVGYILTMGRERIS